MRRKLVFFALSAIELKLLFLFKWSMYAGYKCKLYYSRISTLYCMESFYFVGFINGHIISSDLDVWSFN